MSLLRLLTAGKSLVGLKHPARRYILSRRGALPKFNSKKNPFRPSTRPEPVAAAQDTPAATSLLTESSASTSIGAPAGDKPVDSYERANAAGFPSAARQPVSGSSRLPGLASFFSWLRPKAARNPMIPLAAKSMVQCELSLDAVRVVRNDLSDCDLEIVSARTSAPRQEPQFSLRTMPQTISPESAWYRVSRQLFGAGKT